MKQKTSLQSLILVFFLLLLFIFIATQAAVAEMTLNDNVNIEGELFLNGESSGVTFYDGTTQTTAATPSWHQIMPAAERFELVMNDEAVLDRETGLVWQRDVIISPMDWETAMIQALARRMGGAHGVANADGK